MLLWQCSLKLIFGRETEERQRKQEGFYILNQITAFQDVFNNS